MRIQKSDEATARQEQINKEVKNQADFQENVEDTNKRLGNLQGLQQEWETVLDKVKANMDQMKARGLNNFVTPDGKTISLDTDFTAKMKSRLRKATTSLENGDWDKAKSRLAKVLADPADNKKSSKGFFAKRSDNRVGNHDASRNNIGNDATLETLSAILGKDTQSINTLRRVKARLDRTKLGIQNAKDQQEFLRKADQLRSIKNQLNSYSGRDLSTSQKKAAEKLLLKAYNANFRIRVMGRLQLYHDENEDRHAISQKQQQLELQLKKDKQKVKDRQRDLT